MRLLSLSLDGQYKGLSDQTFSFDSAQGNIIAFIGLNGSGKSQLLELLAETFGYLERYLRDDFKCRNWFSNLSIELRFTNQAFDSETQASSYSVSIIKDGNVLIYRDGTLIDFDLSEYADIVEEILPSQIIGYSSGLNENLQRAFMKNVVQYLDVMNVKRAWEERISSLNEAIREEGKYLVSNSMTRIVTIKPATQLYSRPYRKIHQLLIMQISV